MILSSFKQDIRSNVIWTECCIAHSASSYRNN